MWQLECVDLFNSRPLVMDLMLSVSLNLFSIIGLNCVSLLLTFCVIGKKTYLSTFKIQ